MKTNAKDFKTVKKIKIRLISLLSLLFVLVLINALAFSGWSPAFIAKAISGNYSKTTGQQLTTADWNNLPSDFVARSGGAASNLTGSLDLGNNRINNLADPAALTDAANRRYVDNNAGGVKNVSGVPFKAVCGRTLPGSTNWQQYDAYTVYVQVDTAPAGFTTTPYYFTSLGGAANHYRAIGGSSIYSPTPTGFIVYANYPSPLTATTATNVYQWYINWCGYGN